MFALDCVALMVILLGCAAPLAAQSIEEFNYAASTPQRGASDGEPRIAQVEQQIVKLTNQFRSEHDVPPVDKNRAVDQCRAVFRQLHGRDRRVWP